MDDTILAAMASDMKISKYASESDTQYCNRILYSAMACWIKTVAADKVLGSVDDSGVSRRHILDRCTPILNELLQRHPSSLPWFFPETDADNPVSIIRTRLIRHGDLLNVGFNTNLILAKHEIVPLCDNLATYKGELLSPKINYSGIAALGEPLPIDSPNSAIQDSVTWFNEYVKNAWWEKCNNIDETTQYYDANKKSRNNYSGWQSVIPESTGNLIFARRTINNAGYEYFLLNEKHGNQYIHRIDPFLQEMGLHRKFIFALRSLSNNKVPCQVIMHSDHALLKIWVHLPQEELSLLESYAWPHNTISDVLEWDMKLDIWSYLRPCFEALGFGITEA